MNNQHTKAAAAACLLCGLLLCGCSAGSSKAPETPEEFRAAMIGRAMVSTGNTARLNQVFEKAEAGADITVAYVGGSITEGYAAGVRSPQCYASVSAAGFQETFCKGGTVTCQNNGLSGTPSVLGNLRAPDEVLPSQPDIIFLEFAVNDGQEAEYKVSYESLVRTCLEAENSPAVILLFTYMENGHTCQEQQQEIGAHYDLGMISVRDAILPEIEAGRMAWTDYGDDDVHPTAAGHALIGEFIAEYFRQAKEKKPDRSYEIPADTVHPGLHTGSRLLDAVSLQYQNGSWSPGTNNTRFPAGFVYEKDTGNKGLRFTVTGKTLYLVYKSSKSQDYGMAGVYINGKLSGIVNGYNISGWGDPTPKLIEHFDTETEMNVEIRMLDDHTDKAFEIFAIGVSD